MSQNLDRNKLADSIKKAKPQNLLYLTINSKDKDSFKHAVAHLQSFVGKNDSELVIINTM